MIKCEHSCTEKHSSEVLLCPPAASSVRVQSNPHQVHFPSADIMAQIVVVVDFIIIIVIVISSSSSSSSSNCDSGNSSSTSLL